MLERDRGRSLAAGACLVATALLLASSLRHRELEPTSVLDGPTVVYLSAEWEHAPTVHLDAATAVELAHCPACLLQLKGLGDAASPPRTPAGLVRLASVLQRTDAATAVAPLRLAAARAPPLA